MRVIDRLGLATVVSQLRARGDEESDPVWPMPLWSGYDDELASKVADLGETDQPSAVPRVKGALQRVPLSGALFLAGFLVAPHCWIVPAPAGIAPRQSTRRSDSWLRAIQRVLPAL